MYGDLYELSPSYLYFIGMVALHRWDLSDMEHLRLGTDCSLGNTNDLKPDYTYEPRGNFPQHDQGLSNSDPSIHSIHPPSHPGLLVPQVPQQGCDVMDWLSSVYR